MLTDLDSFEANFKRTVPQDFNFRFFSWISFPQAPEYTWVFQIFAKICGDIRSSRCTPGEIDTGGKRKNLQSEKFEKLCLDTFGL